MLTEDQIDYSILATIGKAIAWIFAPLGWGNWQATVASITGLVAKENIVGTLGILYGAGDGSCLSEYGSELYPESADIHSLYSTCFAHLAFAAIGAIKREMNNAKWTCIRNRLSVCIRLRNRTCNLSNRFACYRQCKRNRSYICNRSNCIYLLYAV